MKKLNLITTLLALLIVLMGCKKETSCNFVYSGWTSCTNNIKTRTYTSSPSGCTGTPPADSTQRSCTLFINDLPVTDIEGTIYNTVKLGSQTWTTKNLNVSKYRNGDLIPEVQSIGVNRYDWCNLTTGAWCYYNNDTSNGSKYGKLYNWYALNDTRGLAPKGYHIPSNEEWITLLSYLGENPGHKMKETGPTHWGNENTLNTNESGFTGLPGGWRGGNEDSGGPAYFSFIGGYAKWWSSSEYNTDYAWCHYTYNGLSKLDNYKTIKQSGFSVRCIKD